MNKAIPRKILLSLAVVMLATLVAAPMVLASPATATRDLPATPVAPSTNFDVGITASGFDADADGFWAGQVVETLPAGFTYVSSSLPAALVTVNGSQVKFTLMGAGSDAVSFTYTVTAPAAAGNYTFGGIVKDEDLAQFTTGGNTQVTVSAAGTFTLTVTAVGPAGSGTTTPAAGTYTYAAGTEVPLTANPNAGWEFSHWSGTDNNAINPTEVTMNADKSVTAYFATPAESFASWLYEKFIECL